MVDNKNKSSLHSATMRSSASPAGLMAKKKISLDKVKHVAKLANLPIDERELEDLARQFEETVNFVDQLQGVDVEDVEPTSQVTGATNVWREDIVEPERILTQDQALSNAPRSYRGFFVVPKIFD